MLIETYYIMLYNMGENINENLTRINIQWELNEYRY